MITILLGAITGFLTSKFFEKKSFSLGGILPKGTEVVITQGNNRPLMKGKVLDYNNDGFYYVNIGTEKRPNSIFVSEYRILN